MSRRVAKKKFTTLRNFLAAVVDGKMTRAEAEETLDNIEIGIGLKKRDRELAKVLGDAPDNYESDPVFVDGFNKGVLAGYEAARADVRNGLDILADLDPAKQAALALGVTEPN